MKKRLTQEQEFQIMKLVLDKFLWVGFLLMAVGLYLLVMVPGSLLNSILLLVGGAVMLVLLLWLIDRHYHIG